MPKAEDWWSQEHIIRELDALGQRLIVEPPVLRGPHKDLRGLTSQERRIQAYRLAGSGWSTAGLASYYGVSLKTVETWLKAQTLTPIRMRHTTGKRSIWLRICEALALIELGLWCQQPRRGRKLHSNKKGQYSRIERRH
jgi:hypothetical protein